MKKSILVALLSCLSLASFAQAVQLSIGKSYTHADASYVKYFQKGNDILAVKANRKQLILQKFDAGNMSLTSSTVYTDVPKGYSVDYATERNNTFYVFYSANKKNSTDAKVYVREIDFEKGSFKESAKEIDGQSDATKQAMTVTSDSSYASTIPSAVRNVNLFEPSEGQVVSTGFYEKNINTSSAGGFFVMKKDSQTGAYYQVRTYDISSALANQYLGGKTKESNFAVKEVLSDNEDNLTLISEDVRQETSNFYTPKGLARTVHYTHYDDILIKKLDAKGELLWIKKIPKRQVGLSEDGQGQMSYASFASSKNYYLLFLDNEKNENLSKDDAPVNYVNDHAGVLITYQVNKENGNVSKINLLSAEDAHKIKGYRFSADRIIALDDQKFILEFTKKGKQDVLIKVSVPE